MLVAGGGIAGTVAALALKHTGFSPVVLEGYERSADGVGAFLTLAVTGRRALRVLGLDADQVPRAVPTPRISLALGNGRRLADFSTGPDGGAVTVRRADLYELLRAEAERRGIPIEYGKRIVDADTVGDRVVARFADGTERAGALLVGADGIRSRVRTLIDPHAPPPRYLGLLNAGGFARVAVPGEVGVMQMFFGKRCFFAYLPAPDGSVWWFANPARAREPSKEELAAMTPDSWRAHLLELFAADATPASELVLETDDIFVGWPTYDLPSVPHWHRGPMVIIGDAAHAASPSSGQGASMAIEDGLVLARCLRDSPTVTHALASYDLARRARVERVVALGKRNGTGKTPGPLGRFARDLALRLIFRGHHTDPMQWLLDEPIAA